MMDENEEIQNKLIDRMVDLDTARNRWIFGIIVSVFLFFVVLGVYIAPVMELSSENPTQHTVQFEAFEGPLSIETVAIPYFYDMYFEFGLVEEYMDEHSNVQIYIFKGNMPPLDQDSWNGLTFEGYLRATSFKNATLTYLNPERDFKFSFRDADSTSFHVILYHPDDPRDPYDDDTVVVDMKTYYEPLLLLVPTFFIIAFLIVLPLAIIRLYVINQKKKEIRVLLTLDLESLSDEDKLRLGIPIIPKQAPPPQPTQPSSPPVAPTTPGQRP